MSVYDNITKKPLLPVVEITKNDDTTYTYNPFTSTFDFYVRDLTFTPAYDSTGGTFSMGITSSDATNSASNTLITNIDEGNEILIYVGKDNTNKTSLFRGVIESWTIQETNKNFMEMTISGPDWGSDILKNRIVTGQWIQDKNSSGVLDSTDTNVEISQIITDLLTLEKSYPSVDVTAEDQGIVVTAANLEGDDIRLAQFNANYEFLDDKLQELDEILGTIHYVDVDKNFIMKFPDETTSSLPADILLTDDNTDATAIAWPSTKVGLINAGTVVKRTLENTKRRVFGMGGNTEEVDQSEETDSSQKTLDSINIAMKFTPQFISLSKVQLLLSKIGTPTIDFVMEIREDFGGKPEGETLRTVSKDKSFLNETGTTARWVAFDINEELNTSKDYWIVVRDNGTDSSNTFRWHHDNTDNNPTSSATSSDDITWTATSTPNRFNYAFITWASTEVIIPFALNGVIVSTDKWIHEDVVRKADITDQATLTALLITQVGTLFKKKEILSCSVYSPDNLLLTGQKVRIRKQASGYTFDDEFVIGSVDYVFQSDETGVDGTWSYNISATRYVDID